MVDIKSTSNAVWWIKYPKQIKHRFTFCQDMTDLFRNISMHGYNKLLELFLYEKFIWFCVHATNFVIVITVLSYIWEQYVSQHFSLILHDPLYPIENIPFPGISICSNNRISRQAAQEYAKELSLKDPHNRSAEYFFNYIPSFITLYYKFQATDNYRDLQKFQSFLDMYGTNENETYYDIKKKIIMLTPSCRDLIVKCLINNKKIECFSKNTFQEGLTMYGPCCIFNTKNSYIQRNSSLRLHGPDQGLTVLLNSTHSNDLVSMLNIDACIVLVHHPNNIPDISSGSAIEVFAMNNEETFIAISSKLVNSTSKLKTFHPSYRKCYFEDEKPNRFFAQPYSFSNCILSCRVHSISTLCGCVPILVPAESLQKLQVPYCSLNHLSCLHRYNFKLRNVLTKRVNILGLEREMEEALYCPKCLPSCVDVQYDTSMMSLPIDRLIIPKYVKNNSKLEDKSVLRIYFGASTALCYKHVISNYWEEAFSTVGNVVSIFLGFSMVAIFEILFFTIKYFYIAGKIVINREHNSKLRKNRKTMKMKSKQLYILP